MRAIINVSSTFGHKPAPGISQYGASKAALEHLTRSWAVELGERGICVNAIAPGPTESEALERSGLPRSAIGGADGSEVAYRRCDIGSAADTSALVTETIARFGRLDGAFNNVGISGGGNGRLADLPEERFDEISRVNFKGIWLAMRAEIPALLRNPNTGAIVNTSIVGGLRGGPDLSAYPATKRAVIGLTTTAAHDYGRDGLRVNAIAPGTTNTEMIAAWKRRDPTIAERLDALTPLGRGGQPDEVAEAAAWLLSDRASYVSGAVLAIDGGMTA